jgi:two-component system CheB/CheR fusion protein
MAREGLRNELPGAFRKALHDFEPVILNNLKIGTNGGALLVNVSIQRLENPEFVRGMFIVVFTDVPPSLYPEAKNSKKDRKSSNARVKDLEVDLQRSMEENQGIREEMQTSQEELKSTNEELQSTNEELQSTNEELTTSKEEMQSLNEELQTVNLELQSKVIDLLKANDDMKNLLNSTEVATLFLDKDLNIRRFTDPVTHIFKLRGTDIGRPFTDLVSNLLYPNIDSQALQVIRTLTSIESANTTTDGRWFNIRIMPYRTTDDRIDGLIMTFNDITDLKNLEIELQAANEALRKEKS